MVEACVVDLNREANREVSKSEKSVMSWDEAKPESSQREGFSLRPKRSCAAYVQPQIFYVASSTFEGLVRVLAHLEKACSELRSVCLSAAHLFS